MTKLEKFSLYMVIFNATYFVSTDVDLIKTGSWVLVIAFGTVFLLFGEKE